MTGDRKRQSPAGTSVSCHPSRVTRHPQQGVALIITLILLSVVLFMALTFMALSSRERGAVATVTDTASARYAADAALANAEAQIIANVLATTNPYNFNLLVSTNADLWIWNTNLPDNLTNLYGFPRVPVLVGSNEPLVGRYYLDLNRNGRYDTNGYSLVISPDPANPYYDTNGNPVASFTPGNTLSSFQVGDPEWIGILERPDAPYGPKNNFIARYAFIAVPAGNTLDINAIHNQAQNPLLNYPLNPMDSVNGTEDGYFRNQGVGSWELNLAAFLADLNTNKWGQAINDPLNTAYYFYQYPSGGNRGFAFADAFALLAYRYDTNYNTLLSVQNLFGAKGSDVFESDNVDGYSDGPLQTGFPLPGDFQLPQINDRPSFPWLGADNTNRFFSHQELFDTSKTAMNVPLAQITAGNDFSGRLTTAGTNVSTYDRYTFYRLLSQLGTDSAAQPDKINLNYDNVDLYVTNISGNFITNQPAATNFMAWTPLAFFTNAADRLLRNYTARWRTSNPTNFATTFYAVYDFSAFASEDQWTNYPAFGIGNIPVLISNQFVYSPAVNRLLQLAANLYDATVTNRFPSVFRPTFWVTNNPYGYPNVYINGYQRVVLDPTISPVTDDPQLFVPLDVTDLKLGASTNNYPSPTYGPNGGVNVYGVPWILGAKKGFPNFNEFSMQDIVQITRKLQVTRTDTNVAPKFPIYNTNQMYVFGITNNLALECWNSYTNTYSNAVTIVVKDRLSMTLTNADPVTLAPGALVITSNYYMFVSSNLTLWPGSVWGFNALDHTAPSPFYIALSTNVNFLPTSVYRFGLQSFVRTTDDTPWETNVNLTQLPHFGLVTSNALQFFMLDGTNVIDYVHLNGPTSRRNLSAELSDPDRSDAKGLWRTNLQGVYNQIKLSRGLFVPNAVPTVDGGAWLPPAGVSGVTTPPQDEAYFNAMFILGNEGTAPAMDSDGSATEDNLSYGTQAPYTPTRTMYEFISWQANDPLVHYLASDLNYSGTVQGNGASLATGIANSDHSPVPYLPNIGNVNDRYAPWGNAGPAMAGIDTNRFNLAYRDPLVIQSDDWDFPTNKLPNVGWIGRVHRGTPWQTVFLKSSNILAYVDLNSPASPVNGFNTWARWTGDTQLAYGQYFDAINSAPRQDRMLFDLFTAAFNDNALRGTLSVNIGATNAPSLAAWSAVFSGLVVPTNRFGGPGNVITNPPAGTYYNPALPKSQQPLLLQLVQGINQTRAANIGDDGLVGKFEFTGDILRTPELTEQSPFLALAGLNRNTEVSDELYEWLPQQIMGLLRCSSSPRYVIYCYGQTLKPAPNAYVTSGPLFGMVTNYQVVSEIATRAVVRFNSLVTNVISTNNFSTNGINWYTVPVVTNNSAVIESFNPLPPD